MQEIFQQDINILFLLPPLNQTYTICGIIYHILPQFQELNEQNIKKSLQYLNQQLNKLSQLNQLQEVFQKNNIFNFLRGYFQVDCSTGERLNVVNDNFLLIISHIIFQIDNIMFKYDFIESICDLLKQFKQFQLNQDLSQFGKKKLPWEIIKKKYANNTDIFLEHDLMQRIIYGQLQDSQDLLDLQDMIYKNQYDVKEDFKEEFQQRLSINKKITNSNITYKIEQILGIHPQLEFVKEIASQKDYNNNSINGVNNQQSNIQQQQNLDVKINDQQQYLSDLKQVQDQNDTSINQTQYEIKFPYQNSIQQNKDFSQEYIDSKSYILQLYKDHNLNVNSLQNNKNIQDLKKSKIFQQVLFQFLCTKIFELKAQEVYDIHNFINFELYQWNIFIELTKSQYNQKLECKYYQNPQKLKEGMKDYVQKIEDFKTQLQLILTVNQQYEQYEYDKDPLLDKNVDVIIKNMDQLYDSDYFEFVKQKLKQYQFSTYQQERLLYQSFKHQNFGLSKMFITYFTHLQKPNDVLKQFIPSNFLIPVYKLEFKKSLFYIYTFDNNYKTIKQMDNFMYYKLQKIEEMSQIEMQYVGIYLSISNKNNQLQFIIISLPFERIVLCINLNLLKQNQNFKKKKWTQILNQFLQNKNICKIVKEKPPKNELLINKIQVKNISNLQEIQSQINEEDTEVQERLSNYITLELEYEKTSIQQIKQHKPQTFINYLSHKKRCQPQQKFKYPLQPSTKYLEYQYEIKIAILNSILISNY